MSCLGSNPSQATVSGPPQARPRGCQWHRELVTVTLTVTALRATAPGIGPGFGASGTAPEVARVTLPPPAAATAGDCQSDS